MSRLERDNHESVSALGEVSADIASTRVITPETPLGGARYPFLEATGRPWSLFSHPIGEPIRYPQAETFTMVKPTLRWINGNHLIDGFVEGQTTEQFLAASGLVLSLDSGGYVLSKRLSRLMRPSFAFGFFPAPEVTVAYQDELDQSQRAVWDGAGIISRRLLERLTLPPDVSAAKRAYLLHELQHCRRVEFTLMTEHGQDKGHAIVADTLPTDFILPRDTKPDVRLTDGRYFVGIDFIHAQTAMRLDIQSLINLHPFFEEASLVRWLAEEGELFAHAVQSGSVGQVMPRLDRVSSLSDLTQWPLREYLAIGGQPLWFSGITRNLMNQHLARLTHDTGENLRLPIPGGRLYVMPIGVGQAAGVEYDVPRGHVRLDRSYATAWVNDEDWVQLEGADTGIARLLGGADNDDALWVHGFTDYDGTLKVLCWRSPNQVGEYVLLAPTIGSYNLDWPTTAGPVQYPPGDSRRLPPRKDTVQTVYQPGIDPATAGGLGEGRPYSIQGMVPTIRRAIANAGVLGMYCNALMVHKAITGETPAMLPAALEAVIDGSVKTGADLSGVKRWCFEEATRLRTSQTPIPTILANRVVGSQTEPVTLTQDHWLDRLTECIQDHIATFSHQRDSLAQTAMPPAVIFDHAFDADDPTALEAGAGLLHVYNNAIRQALRKDRSLSPEAYDAARHEAEAYLAQFPAEQQTAVVRGAIVSGYMRDKPSDAVLWLVGDKTPEGQTPGIASFTIQALREVGVLDELGETKVGLLRYPGAVVETPRYQHSIGITGVWFNWFAAWRAQHGYAPPAAPSDVSPPAAQWAKDQITALARSTYRNLPLVIEALDDRKVARTPDGNLFGYISRDCADHVPLGPIILTVSLCQHGNLRALWQPAPGNDNP